MKEELRQFVIDALREMNYDVSEVTDTTELGPAGLDLESLALAELAVRLEDRYRLAFSDDDMESLALMTLDEFTTAVADRLAGADAPTAGSATAPTAGTATAGSATAATAGSASAPAAGSASAADSSA
jgi:acyl carrier protein